MVRVEGRAGENLEKLLRRFKKACQREGIIGKSRQNNFRFEKPSDKKRRKLNASRRAREKELRKKPVRAKSRNFSGAEDVVRRPME